MYNNHEMVASGLDLDPAISALLGDTTTEIDVARKNRVFCNRNLRMDSIEMIGFDMDYTLALYHQDKLEQLSISLTLDKLIGKHGYPDAIRAHLGTAGEEAHRAGEIAEHASIRQRADPGEDRGHVGQVRRAFAAVQIDREGEKPRFQRAGVGLRGPEPRM